MWFVRWRKKDIYFGVDRTAAAQSYANWLRTVYLPAAEQNAAQATANAGGPRTLLELAEAWLTDVSARGTSKATIDNYRRGLRPLLHALGTVPLGRLTPSAFTAVRADLVAVDPPLSPKTINNALAAWRMLISWAQREGHGLPMNLKALHAVKAEPPSPPVFSPRCVRQLLSRAAWQTARDCARTDRRTGAEGPSRRSRPNSHRVDLRHRAVELYCVMAAQYLTACRPSEVVRLFRGEGKFVSDHCFQLSRSKTSASTQTHRVLVFSEEALGFYRRCLASMASAPDPSRRGRFRWPAETSYSHAVRKALGPCGLPHLLRHSAVSHLDAAGVEEADLRRVLGHVTTGALRNYLQRAHTRLLPVVRQLTLRSADGV